MQRLFWILSLILLSTAAAPAMRIVEQDFVCPVDAKPFSQMLPISGYSTGAMLDFQLQGAIVSPTPLPVCPSNGFVMFKDEFAADEIAKIKVMVSTPEFAAVKARGNEWLLAVWEMKQLNQDARGIASMYLAATWSAGFEYQQITSEAYEFVLAMNDPLDFLILGEWERRLGRFDEARERFSTIPQNVRDAFATAGWTQERLRAYVDQQRALVAARNSDSAPFTA